jgi:hypothetical protein
VAFWYGVISPKVIWVEDQHRPLFPIAVIREVDVPALKICAEQLNSSYGRVVAVGGMAAWTVKTSERTFALALIVTGLDPYASAASHERLPKSGHLVDPLAAIDRARSVLTAMHKSRICASWCSTTLIALPTTTARGDHS